MNLTGAVVLNIFSIVLLAILCPYSMSAADRKSRRHRQYLMLLFSTMVMLVTDIFSRFDGLAHPSFPLINRTANFLLFALEPSLSSLWLAYVLCQIRNGGPMPARERAVILALNAANLAAVAASQFTGWYYFIDAGNIYQRGPAYLLSHAVTLMLLVWAYAAALRNRKAIGVKVFYSFLFFPVLPLVGVLLQNSFYGIPFSLNAIVPSELVLLLYAQDDSIYTDYLTGVGNRKKLESVLKEKVAKSSRSRTFAFVMLDIDNFKKINDTSGHEAGDRVLKAAADLLKRSVRANDYVTRYGGDEFCLILDTSEERGLARVTGRIDHALSQLNESGALPFTLSFSMGCAVYDFQERLSAEAFLNRVDMRMYENKRARSAAR